MVNWFTIVLPAVLAVGYWAIGYLVNKMSDKSMPFDWRLTARTLASGLVVGFIQAFAGMTVDPLTVNTWAAVDSLLVIALSKFWNVYSGAPVQAAPVPAAMTAPAAAVVPEIPKAAVPEAVAMVKADRETALPLSVSLYPPAYEDYGPMSVLFTIDAYPRMGPDAAERYILDFGDGSPVAEGVLYYGIAQICHNYDWKFDGKYSGKTYYPEVTVIGLRGTVISTADTPGKESFITVHDKAHEQALGIPMRKIPAGTSPNIR